MLHDICIKTYICFYYILFNLVILNQWDTIDISTQILLTALERLSVSNNSITVLIYNESLLDIMCMNKHSNLYA